MYKRGQGRHTRTGTAIGGAIIIIAGADFVYDNLAFDESTALGLWLQFGIPLAFLLVMGLVLFWVVGRNRSAVDFMIATEGEMKKVNWSTKRELKASTMVVIIVTLLMAALLFGVDYGFMRFFEWIGVLRGGGP